MPRKLDHASINSLAYDLVTGADYSKIYAAYMLTPAQLLHEVKTNIHLKQATSSLKDTIRREGSLDVSIKAVLAESLPHILKDNIDPETEPSIRSRNLATLLNYTSTKSKIAADLEKADKGTSATMGVQVVFNASSGIRGISDNVTINQTQE